MLIPRPGPTTASPNVSRLPRRTWKPDLPQLCFASKLTSLRFSLKDEYESRLMDHLLPPSAADTSAQRLLSLASAGSAAAVTLITTHYP